jgi:predicted metallo-beta-lactamase superfamily hydrolase
VKRRRSDVAFYGLLASTWVVAGVFALWHHERRAVHGQVTQARTGVVATTDISRRHAPLEHHTPRAGVRRERTLTIRASRGPSWIAIRARSSRGPILYQGILEQGKTVEEHGSRFWTVVGAVENVDVRLDHHAVRLGRSALRGVLLASGQVRATQPSSRGGIVGS